MLDVGVCMGVKTTEKSANMIVGCPDEAVDVGGGLVQLCLRVAVVVYALSD